MLVRKPAGIHLERKKEASLLNWNLKRPYPPETVRVPVPSTSTPCVRIGDEVVIGQKIAVPRPINRSEAEIGAVPTTVDQKKIKVGAEPQGAEGVSIHASMSGKVERIAEFPNALGGKSLMVEIRRPKEPKPLPVWELRKDWEQIQAEKIPGILRDSGLVTTDTRVEPVDAKLARHAGAGTILINLCDPEPYITCEQVLAMSHPVEILRGAELLRKAAGAEKIIFAFEDSDLETVELIKSKIYFLKWAHVEVRTVPALYPQGLESTLPQAWFSGEENSAVPIPINLRESEIGAVPTTVDQEKIKVGAVVFPASTAFAVYEAVATGKPFYERVVTVGGECVVEPRSLWLPFGISFRDAIHACKGVMREPGKVLMGGPMAGTAQASLEVPVTAATSAVLALPREVVKEEREEPCIRCNLCVDHCPVSLSPAMITLAAEAKEFAVAREWDAPDCIECGVCAYVCPSKRPMLELVRLANAPEGMAVIHG